MVAAHVCCIWVYIISYSKSQFTNLESGLPSWIVNYCTTQMHQGTHDILNN